MFGFLPFTREGRRRAASRWLARLHRPDTDENHPAFQRWMSHKENAEAFASVSRSYNAAALLRLSGHPSQPLPRRARLTPRQALAAALAVAVMVPIALIVSRSFVEEEATARLMVSTAVGEIRAVRLSDGSSIVLDTDTQIRLPIGDAATEVMLERGRARFSPANSLTVKSSLAVVKGKGGSFDVGLSHDELAVSSHGGEVSVTQTGDPAGARIEVRPGEELRLSDGDIEFGTIADRQWPAGVLQFDGVPLSEAIERANRYSTEKIKISDDGLDQLRFTGVFKAGEAEVLAKAIARTFGLRLRQERQELILTNK